MTEQATPEHQNGTEALYLQQYSGDIVVGKVIQNIGSEVLVQSSVNNEYGSTHVSERHHVTDVFSVTEAASVAGDLLPTPADGKELVLRDALKSVTADPEKSTELKIRLESEAVHKRLSTPRSDSELGVVSKDKLLGSMSRVGSNIWKVNDMLEGLQTGHYEGGMTSVLNLARPSKGDLSLLPGDEVTRIHAAIDETNRTTLNELYETYYVDFAKASVWERTDGAHRTRMTIYPTVSGLISFVETHFTPIDSQPVSNSPIEAKIVAGVPSDLAEQGYSPAI